MISKRIYRSAKPLGRLEGLGRAGWSGLPAWLDDLDPAEFRRVWVAAVADLASLDPPNLRELCHVLSYVRDRYKALDRPRSAR